MRFRRRVSPTSLTSPLLRSPTRPLSSLSDISPALHFPYPVLPASPCLLYCHVVLVLTLSRERVTLSTSSTSNNPPFPSPPFSPCRRPRPRPHRISTVAHPRLFRPDLFERQNVLGTLILCGSEREGEKEGERKGDSFSRRQKRELCGSYECFGAPARL